MKVRLGVLLFIVLISGSLLLILSLGNKPVGYLHSWNQVTTLSHIREIARDPEMWKNPIDVVTRLSAHPVPKLISLEAPYSDFRIYEEFPLYHLLSAHLSKSGISLENSSKIISILSFFIASFGIYSLTMAVSSYQSSITATILWCISFPVLYYSQAIMSDIGMTAFTIWGLYFLVKYIRNESYKTAISGLICIAISSLFKSYGLLFMISWVYIFFRKKRFLSGLFLCALFSLPVLSWHIWTLLQEGHQEITSHNISDKIKILFSAQFYLTLQKYLFRYLGILPGIVLLIYLLQFLGKKSKVNPNEFLLFLLWGVPSFIYLIFTAEKLPDHDYYFLLIAPGFFVMSGLALNYFWNSYNSKNYQKYLFIGYVVIVLSPLPQTYLSLKKSLKENHDVIVCSDTISQMVPEKNLVGYLSDVSRYNSLAYYAGRFGLIIEDQNFPLSHYLGYGMNHIAVNLPDEDFEVFSNWLNQQKDIETKKIIHLDTLLDFKSRKRNCGIWEIH